LEWRAVGGSFPWIDASSESKFRRLEQRYRQLMQVASGFIVKSIPMRSTLQSLGAPADRVLISPSGADAALFQGASPETAPPTFLAVGGLYRRKVPCSPSRPLSVY
jgi:hypothetical protein